MSISNLINEFFGLLIGSRMVIIVGSSGGVGSGLESIRIN